MALWDFYARDCNYGFGQIACVWVLGPLFQKMRFSKDFKQQEILCMLRV